MDEDVKDHNQVAKLLKENDILEGVDVNMKEELGRGSYAVVYQAEWRGLYCVAKIFHDVLFPNNQSYTWKQLAREIYFLRHIRHPNIVQLLGFIRSRVPTIVMERLHTNLTTLVEKHHPFLLFETQVSILHDVAIGLNFLHSYKEPIIHRDLSSNNILLTEHLVAKISDLGLAKHIKSAKQQAGSLAGFGAQFYMPPEVLGQNPPKISVKMDIFSFGVVMLQVAIGIAPDVRGVLNIDSESTRRKHHLVQLDKSNLFYPLVLQCLSDNSENRPDANALSKAFKKIGLTRKSTIQLIETFQQEKIKFEKQLEAFQLQIVLSKIKVGQEIGTGSFGKVLVAEYCGLLCAAKEFNPNLRFEVSSKESKVFFLKKIQRIVQLCHPNVVRCLGVYCKPDGFLTIPLLVMEMMDCSLSVLLNDRPNLPIDVKLSVLLDVSLGLKFLHCQEPSVVHCNLSSNNILLTPHLQAKISDVGVATVIPEASLKKYMKITCFVAPEIFKSAGTLAGKNFDSSVDVFSYGAIILHTFIQRLPELKLLNTRLSQYTDKIISYDKELDLLVGECLNVDPCKRPTIEKVSETVKKLAEKCRVMERIVFVRQSELQKITEEAKMMSNKSQPWKYQAPTTKEMIEKFRSRTKDAIPCLGGVKKVDQQSGHSLIKLEWYGKECSGKYGFLIRSDYQGQDDIKSIQSSANALKKLYKLPANDPNTIAYSTDQLKRILDSNEAEIKYISTMRHENIITLLGVYYEDSSGNILPMLVMESVWCDLDYYFLHYAETFTCNEDLLILLGISSGLMYLHEVKSIIHNRVVTNSVLLTKNLVVKLSNFESAVIIDKSADKVIFSQSSDVFLFGIILSKILSMRLSHPLTEDDESLKKLLDSLFELCTSIQLNNRPTFCYILKALKKHKRSTRGQLHRPQCKMQAANRSSHYAIKVNQLEKDKEELQAKVQELSKMNKLLQQQQLTELEELSFKFTNAFTTAGEGSVMKLRDTYRSLQTNGRPAANCAHKKTYKGIPYPIAEHTMLAYEEAKALALKEFKVVSEKFHSLFQLKPSTDSNTSQEKEDKAMRQSQQLLESFHAKPLNEKVYQILIEKYKALTNQAPDGIPKPIEDYYSELAKFTWDCVARTIPMIMSTEIGKFASDVHETNDGDDEDDDDSNKGKFVSYIYPVLFTSNSWPREIAMKGRVNILPSQESIV